jgi:hypothetical protein
MRYFQKFIPFPAIMFCGNPHVIVQAKTLIAVTRIPSSAVTLLLKFFYNILGEYLQTGHHNFPDARERDTNSNRQNDFDLLLIK